MPLFVVASDDKKVLYRSSHWSDYVGEEEIAKTNPSKWWDENVPNS